MLELGSVAVSWNWAYEGVVSQIKIMKIAEPENPCWDLKGMEVVIREIEVSQRITDIDIMKRRYEIKAAILKVKMQQRRECVDHLQPVVCFFKVHTIQVEMFQFSKSR